MTELGYTEQTMSCPVTYKTNMPAAINAFANTLFICSHWETLCIFLLPFYMVALCGVVISVAIFKKLTNTVHFFSFLEFCNYMQYIPTPPTGKSNELRAQLDRLNYLNKWHWVAKTSSTWKQRWIGIRSIKRLSHQKMSSIWKMKKKVSKSMFTSFLIQRDWDWVVN